MGVLMRIDIDEQLTELVSEEWFGEVLSVVDEDLLRSLSIEIIEPTRYWLPYSDKELKEKLRPVDLEKYLRERQKRNRLGRCTGPKRVELYITEDRWTKNRSDLEEALFHEVYHANDPEFPTEAPCRGLTLEGYLRSPREVRARAFAERMLRELARVRAEKQTREPMVE